MGSEKQNSICGRGSRGGGAFALHMAFHCFKRNVTDMMLHTAGIRGGRRRIHTDPDQKSGQQIATLIDFFRDLSSRVGQMKMPVLVGGDVSPPL